MFGADNVLACNCNSASSTSSIKRDPCCTAIAAATAAIVSTYAYVVRPRSLLGRSNEHLWQEETSSELPALLCSFVHSTVFMLWYSLLAVYRHRTELHALRVALSVPLIAVPSLAGSPDDDASDRT